MKFLSIINLFENPNRSKNSHISASSKAVAIEHEDRQDSLTTKTPPTNDAPQDPRQAAMAQQPNVSSAYVLKRDYMGSCRLNLQYYLWKEALGFNLHPSIDVQSLGPAPRVADIATGTGIWLMESRSLFPPSSKLDGFDIDLAQAPHTGWFPENISLRQWDMFSEVPEDLVGTYDIVHIRLVMLVIKDNNPIPLINNLRKLLKPGGYLQWDEIDQVGKHVVKVSDEVRSDGINAMFRINLPSGVKGSDDWQTELATTLTTQGFASAEKYLYEPSATTARYWHDMYTLAWDELLTLALGPNAPQALLAAEQGMNEARNGAVISMPMIVWVARTP